MKTETELMTQLKDAKYAYKEEIKILRIVNGRISGDYQTRRIVLKHLLDLTIEIEILEGVLNHRRDRREG